MTYNPWYKQEGGDRFLAVLYKGIATRLRKHRDGHWVVNIESSSDLQVFTIGAEQSEQQAKAEAEEATKEFWERS